MRIDITELVPQGLDNALAMTELATRCGSDVRTVRKLIEKARRQGVPICASNAGGIRGYYFPVCASEARIYLKSQRSRINTGQAVIAAVEEYVRRESGEIGG